MSTPHEFDLWREEIARYAPGMFELVRECCPWLKRDQIEDVAQEALLQVLGNRQEDVATLEQVQATVHKIAADVYREQRKHVEQQRYVKDAEGKETNLVDLAGDESSDKEEASPTCRLLRFLESWLIARGLRGRFSPGFLSGLLKFWLYGGPSPCKDAPSFSDEQRGILRAWLEDDRNYAVRLAQQIGKPAGTIRVMLLRVLGRMRKYLGVADGDFCSQPIPA